MTTSVILLPLLPLAFSKEFMKHHESAVALLPLNYFGIRRPLYETTTVEQAFRLIARFSLD